MRLPEGALPPGAPASGRSTGRSFYNEEFLQRRAAVVRPALFPVQHSAHDFGNVERRSDG